ncbi:hypothetical protein ACC733_29625 [Rhizobium johnstonii]
MTGRLADLHAGARLLLQHETITPADFEPLQRRNAPEAIATPTAALAGAG